MRPADGLLRLPALDALAGIGHAFEARQGRLETELPFPVARPRQVHGDRVVLARPGPLLDALQSDARAARPEGDAVITDATGITVAVATADCVPILVADPVAGAIAAVHAGWRGLAAGVIPRTLAEMRDRLGGLGTRCSVGIGPSVRGCCYRVRDDVIESFEAAGIADAAFADGHREIPAACDLVAAARLQLCDAGIDPAKIGVVDACTCCDEGYWSYRRHGGSAGRMLAGICSR